MATLDRRTCIRCGERDGEIFALKDMNRGENAPPLHPRCRCTIVAYLDKPTGERFARQVKRERVPADVTYKEWRKQLEKTGFNPKIEIKPLTTEQIKTIRSDEDKAFKAATDSDFGFKK